MKRFENTNISLEIPCETLVNGICDKTNTVEECIQKCNPPDCYWGKWSHKTKQCTPVKYYTHKNLNPTFLFRDEPDTVSFVDTSFFSYPPEKKNRVFFYDKIRLQNVETGQFLTPDVYLKPTKPYLPFPAINYIPIQSTTPVLFYSRYLDSVIRAEGNFLNWYKSVEFMNEEYESFFLEPAIDIRDYNPELIYKTKDVFYSDVFRIRNILNMYWTYPPLYNMVKPRVNDLSIHSLTEKLPQLFRFVYIPVNALE